MTTEDKRAQIDRRFDETFAVFDERMRKEQETISQERAARGSGSGPAGGVPEGEESGDGQPGEGGEAEGRPGEDPSGAGGEAGAEGESAGERSGEQGGGGGVGGGGPLGGSGPNTVPADIPDGRDDDIVARQLREAAMKETDPELRERLWEEYRQYKQSTR
jgi:hypothetical protein